MEKALWYEKHCWLKFLEPRTVKIKSSIFNPKATMCSYAVFDNRGHPPKINHGPQNMLKKLQSSFEGITVFGNQKISNVWILTDEKCCQL